MREYCTASKVPKEEDPESIIKQVNETLKGNLITEQDLQASCSPGHLDWRKLADRVQASLEATGNPVQVSLQFDEEDLREGQHLLHFSIGYLPPHGGSLSVLKTTASSALQAYQVELSGSEDAAEERLEVTWILPFTAAGGGGGDGGGTLSLLLVTQDGRYCQVELLGGQKKPINCILARPPSL